MTIMNIINACATELAKNATTDPMLALSAFQNQNLALILQ